MATSAKLVKGKIVIVVGGKSYPTGVAVTEADVKAGVSGVNSKLNTAIVKFKKKHPDVAKEAKFTGDVKNKLAKSLYNAAKGKAKAPPKEKKPPTKKKPKVEKKPAEKKPPKEKKKKEKPGVVKEKKPQKKAGIPYTISISESVISQTLNTVKGKKDKKIQKELKKLAGAYGTLGDFVGKNKAFVTAETFNVLFALDDFKEYFTPDVIEEHPEFMKLLEHLYEEEKLSKNTPKNILELADSAMRSYLGSVAEDNKKFSQEAEVIGGISTSGGMDGKLFMLSLLYLRRVTKPGANVLKLELVKEKPAVEAKVKYKI